MSVKFKPQSTRLVALVKKVVLTDKKGIPFTQVVLEVQLPKHVDRSSLARLQAQFADVYLETIPLHVADEIVYDPEEEREKAASGPQPQ